MKTAVVHQLNNSRTRLRDSRVSHTLPRLLRRRLLVVIGDSHVRPLRSLRLPDTSLRVTSVQGATASGVVNPNSATQALPKFLHALRHTPPGTDVVVGLGEVDAGFLVFLRAQADGGTVRHYTDDALAKFREFVVGSVVARGFRPLLLSATAPTVDSYASWEGLGGARRQVDAARSVRAAETAYWNDRCAEWCVDIGGVWLDLTPDTTNPDGSVRADCRHPDPENHHLHPERYRRAVARLLADEGYAS